MDRVLFVVIALAVVAWLWKPLRVYLVRRLDLTAKVLIVVLPLFLAGRVAYTIYRGEVDDLTFSLLVLGGLLLAWAGLWGLGRWLDKRRPAPASPPRAQPRHVIDVVSAATGVRVPRVPDVSQETMDRAAVTVGRTAGRLVGKWRQSQRQRSR